jgi:hypothetical protein
MKFPYTLPHATNADIPEYTGEEWRAWQWLRLRLQEGHNRWSSRELAHLRFMRWRALTGHLIEDGRVAVAEAGAGADAGALD